MMYVLKDGSLVVCAVAYFAAGFYLRYETKRTSAALVPWIMGAGILALAVIGA